MIMSVNISHTEHTDTYIKHSCCPYFLISLFLFYFFFLSHFIARSVRNFLVRSRVWVGSMSALSNQILNLIFFDYFFCTVFLGAWYNFAIMCLNKIDTDNFHLWWRETLMKCKMRRCAWQNVNCIQKVHDKYALKININWAVHNAATH